MRRFIASILSRKKLYDQREARCGMVPCMRRFQAGDECGRRFVLGFIVFKGECVPAGYARCGQLRSGSGHSSLECDGWICLNVMRGCGSAHMRSGHSGLECDG